MNEDFAADILSIQRIEGIDAILEEICRVTGMGFAAVARVTAERWIACQVLDRIAFGLDAGGELDISTTICDEIRTSGTSVMIDHVSREPMWRTHPTPLLYGFQSYISVPIVREDGSLFGTLCAIDPAPRKVSLQAVAPRIAELAAAIARSLDAAEPATGG